MPIFKEIKFFSFDKIIIKASGCTRTAEKAAGKVMDAGVFRSVIL